MRTLRAFSIIELLTALVLLAVGLAAFTRAVGATLRLEGDARLRRVVASVIRSRLDSLGGVACGTERSGTSLAQGVRERWHISPSGRRVLLTDTIDVVARPALARTLATTLACRP
jgi:type II secretory pathway pseudopilin PulG